MIPAFTVAVLVHAGVAGGPASAQGAGSFDAALRQVEAAQVELVRGNPGPFKQLWAHADDVTLIGGLGGRIERGWPAVSERLDWVGTQYVDGTRTHEEISRVVGQDLAYVIQRETIRFKAPRDGREMSQVLRSTMVFRRDGDAWRIVHRHADSQNVRESR